MAKCLGAKTVSARALQCAQESRVLSEVVEDAEAVRAVEQFLGEYQGMGTPRGVPNNGARLSGCPNPYR